MEDKELEALINKAVLAGESDEDIDLMVQYYRSSKQQSSPTPQPQAKPQEQEIPVVTGQGMVADYLANTSLGKTIVSGLADTTPQMAYTAQQRTASEKAQSASQATDPASYIEKDKLNFQQWVRETQGLKWYQPFDMDKWRHLAPNYIEDQKALTNKAVELERKVQKEKDEAQARLAGVVTDIHNVGSASDLVSYIGHMAGQGLYQIPASIATAGQSSVLMESAIIYDTQLDLLAEKYGISREEVIKRGLDEAAAGQAMAGVAAGLDVLSAGKILEIFRKSAGKGLTRKAVENFLSEATTETLQGNVERGAAASGAGVEFDITSEENLKESLNEFIGGGIGGATVGAMTGSDAEQAEEWEEPTDAEIKEIETLIGQDDATRTGDEDLDAMIDKQYADIAVQLDNLGDIEAKIGKEFPAFNKLDEENEILEDNLTPEDAALVQRNRVLDPNEQELLLDDSERTPEIAKRLPGTNDENEIPFDNLTAEDAARVQANTVLRSRDQELLLDGADQTPNIPGQTPPTPPPTAPTQPPPVAPAPAAPESTVPVRKATRMPREGAEEKKQWYWITGNDKTGYRVVDKQPRTKEVMEPFESREAAERGIAQLHTSNVMARLDQEEAAQREQEKAALVEKEGIKSRINNDPSLDEISRSYLWDLAEGNVFITGEDDRQRQLKAVADQMKRAILGRELHPDHPDYQKNSPWINFLKKAAKELEALAPQSQAMQDAIAQREADKPKRLKPSLDPAEQKQNRLDKYQKQLENIKKDKPAKQLKRLEILNENTLDLPEINDQVRALQDKLKKTLDDKEFEKQSRKATPKERVEMIRTRNTDEGLDTPLQTLEVMLDKDPTTVTEDDYKQLTTTWQEAIEPRTRGLLSTESSQLEKVYDDLKKAWDKVLEPARKEAAKADEAKSKEKQDQRKVKDKHLTSVAKALALDNPVSLDAAVNEYSAWRKVQGLKEQTPDEIKKAASAEFYVKKAENAVKLERLEAAARAKREAEQKKEAEKKAREQDIKDQFDLSDDTEIDFMGYNGDAIPSDLRAYVKNPTKVTFSELYERMKSMYTSGKGSYLDALSALVKLSDVIANKFYKNGLEIFLVDDFKLAKGLSANDLQTNRKIIIIDRSVYGDTDAHELIHYITRAAMAGMALKRGAREGAGKSLNRRTHNSDSDKYLSAILDFYTKIDSIHKEALTKYRDILKSVGRKFAAERELTTQEVNFLSTLSAYLSRRQVGGMEIISDFKQIKFLLDDTFNPLIGTAYGFSNADEMMAEGLSNPYFMMLLGQMESSTPRTGNKANTYFRQLLDSLRFLLNHLIKIGIPLKYVAPVENNLLDKLVDHLSDIEQRFLNPESSKYIAEFETQLNIMENKAAADRLMASSYLYMAAGGTNIPKRNRMTKELRALMHKVANAWWKRDTLQSQDAVMREMDKINAKTTKNKLTDLEAAFVWKTIQRYRQELADAKTIQQNSLDFARGLADYQTDKIFRKDVQMFSEIDLDSLNRKDIKVIVKGILDMVMGGPPSHRAYNLLNKDQAIKKLNRLSRLKGKLKISPGLLRHIANPATFSTILAKYKTEDAQLLFKEIYGDLLEARTDSQREANKLNQQLIDISNKRNLDHTDFVRAHMYGVAFSTFSSPNSEEFAAEVQENLDRIVQNAENKLTAYNKKTYRGRQLKEQIENELKVAQELRKAIMANPDPDAKILTAGQQDLYNAFRDFLTKYEDDIERNTKGVWGADFTKQFNYMPTFALGRVRTGAHEGKDDLIPNKDSNNLWDAMTQGINFGKIVGKQSGNTKEKNQPKNYFYDYDILSVAGKFAAPTLFDIYASKSLKQLNILLHGAAGNPITNQAGKDIEEYMSPEAASALSYQIKSIVGTTVVEDRELNNLLKGIINTRNNIATAMMVTAGQFITQASSAFPAAMIMSPSGFPKALKVMTGFNNGVLDFQTINDFLEREGLSIQLRDVLFERFQTLEDVRKTGLSRGIANARILAEKTASFALRSSDKFAARLVWFSAYFDAGGTLENPTRDAVLAAERAVGLMQNMSDVTFSAPIFRSANSQTRILIHMLYAFKSFALNSALNTYYSLRYSMSSGEARRVLVANIGMAAAYQAAALYLIRPFYENVSDFIFGEDDDEEEEKNYSKQEQLLWGMFWDLGIGQAAPAVIDNIFRYSAAEAAKKIGEKKNGTYDPYLDFPLYAPPTWDKALAETSGGYGDIALVAADAATFALKNAGEALDLIEKGDPIDDDILHAKLWYDAAIMVRWVPFRGDLQKLLRNYEKKLKAQKRNAGGTSAPAGEDGELGTEFEFTDYEIEYVEPGELPELE